MLDLEAKVIGKVTFTEDGVIIPIDPHDFIKLQRKFKTYVETGPEACPTLHLEKDGIAICVVPKGGDADGN